jgi:hypothetical protein
LPLRLQGLPALVALFAAQIAHLFALLGDQLTTLSTAEIAVAQFAPLLRLQLPDLAALLHLHLPDLPALLHLELPLLQTLFAAFGARLRLLLPQLLRILAALHAFLLAHGALLDAHLPAFGRARRWCGLGRRCNTRSGAWRSGDSR